MRFHIFALLLLAGFSFACSGSSPTNPSMEKLSGDGFYKFVNADQNTLILGAWDITIDPREMKVEATECRDIEKHFDVSSLLKPPACSDCFLVKNLKYDSSTSVVTVDIGFKNPSAVNGYDVRGIITEFGNMEFLNPDGYIDLFSPVPGQINPFVAYITGVGNREFLAHATNFETLQIYDPDFPKFAAFKYIVEASWPTNCKEPYEVSFFDIGGTLLSDGSNSQQMRLVARDWQNDIASVNVDLTPIGGNVVALTPDSTLTDGYKCNISAKPGTKAGTYTLQIWATSAPPTDQVATMYNYMTVTVVNPPPIPVETFGPEERVTSTSGEDFIWPRHAIAVTSDNVPHAVWVDNSPDPQSNQFHVFYADRASGAWTAPKQIDSAEGWATYATIAADNNDVLYVVWEDTRNHILGSDIYIASSLDNFSSETLLVAGADEFRTVHPKIVAAVDGTLHVIWHSQVLQLSGKYEYDVWYMRRPAGETTWEGASSIASVENLEESYPSLAAAPNGKAYVAFASNKSTPHGIYFTENTSGSFTEPVLVTSTGAYQPALAVEPDGNLLVAYFDTSGGTYSNINIRESSDGGKIWGSPTAIGESLTAWQVAPDLLCTSNGDIHLAWHEEDDSGVPGKVYYREYVVGLGWQDIIELVSAEAGPFQTWRRIRIIIYILFMSYSRLPRRPSRIIMRYGTGRARRSLVNSRIFPL